MISAHQTVVDSNPLEQPQTAKQLASWYAPGWSDGIGDRLLMFDNTSAPSLELLRFKRMLAAAPGFEHALRARVERLRRFHHPSFSEIRSVQWLDGGGSLALVSNHVPGKRLSEILRDAQGPAFAMALIRQLTPALVLLQEQGDGVAHGALAADRIVVTPEGRLVVVEHVLGSALERLNFTAERLWADLRIAAAPSAQAPKLDARTDVVQLALIAVTLLLGRPLRAAETPHHVSALLEQIAKTSGERAPAFLPLRRWLERALQIDGRLFESASDAQEALDDLPYRQREESPDFSRLLLPSAAGSVVDAEPAAAPPHPEPFVVRPRRLEEPVAPSARPETPAEWHMGPEVFDPLPKQTVQFPSTVPAEPEEPTFADEDELFTPIASSRRPASLESVPRPGPAEFEYRPAAPAALREPVGVRRNLDAVPPVRTAAEQPARKRTPAWLTASLALLVVGEALVIGGLVYVRGPLGAPAITIDSLQPGLDVVVDGRSVGVTPLKLTVDSRTRSVRVIDRAVVPTAAATSSRPEERPQEPPVSPLARPAAASAPAPRTGTLRISAPIDLEVMENGRLVGSTGSGSIVMSAGPHQLDLVNSALGYRSRQAVVVKTGRTTSLGVSVPAGRLSINALPWAEVWIDGKLAGETPLGNLSIQIGSHDIVFRHPQLGERRQSAIVRADTVTRVSANLQQ
jgi:hypothetical protein